MRGRTNMAAGGGGAEWKELPAAAQTRAPSYGYYPFTIAFDTVPEGIVIKGRSGSALNSVYMAYSIETNQNASFSQTASVINASLSGNTLTGTLQHADLEFQAPFYYKTF